MKSKNKIQAYVAKGTKDAIVKIAKDKNTSESYIAGQILDNALTETIKTNK